MNPPLRWLGRLALATLTLSTSPARADDVQPLGDTTLAPLGRDFFAVSSASSAPAVRHRGTTARIGAVAVDPDAGGPPVIELATDVALSDGARGTFALTFDGQTASSSHFDGRFLSGDELTREQGYRMEASWSFATAYTFDLYRGGVRVATADVVDGVAPFVLEGIDRVESAYAIDAHPLASGGEQLELHSWSLGTLHATFDDGATLTVDRVDVAAHEAGHLQTLRHDLGASTVQAGGVSSLQLGVEDLIVADGARIAGRVVDRGDGRASIDLWTGDHGGLDVHGVFVAAGPTIADPRTTVLAAPTGYRIRLRSRRDGAPFGAWSAWSTSATLVTPAPAAVEAIDDLEVEIQRAGGPTIASSGYIRVKKLNSGG